MLSHDDQLLISSYIDGEVSPDERVRAEQLLVDDAAARAYREELLSMSAGLKSLPQHTLPADFADDVLAAAERAMFTGEPWPGDTDTESPSLATRVFNSRTIAYAGATIAAALLVALFLPSGVLENNPNENVAHKAEDEDKSEAPAAKAEKKAGSGTQSAESGLNSIKKGGDSTEDQFPSVQPKHTAESSGKVRPVKDGSNYFGGKGGGATKELKSRDLPPRPAAADPQGLPARDKGAGRPQPGARVPLAEKLGFKQDDAFAAEAPKEILTASYNVSVVDYGAGLAGGQRRAGGAAERNVEERVFQHARRKLAKRGVAWPGLKKNSVSGDSPSPVAPSQEHVRALESAKADLTALPTKTSDKPVVVYLEATEAQAQSLLAALDSDPYFFRVQNAKSAATNSLIGPPNFGHVGGIKDGEHSDTAPTNARDLAIQEDSHKSKGDRNPKLKAYRLSRAQQSKESEEGGLVRAFGGGQSGGEGAGRSAEGDKKEKTNGQSSGDKSAQQGRSPAVESAAASQSLPARAMTGRLVVVFRLIDAPQEANVASEASKTETPSGAADSAAEPPQSSDAKPGE